MRPPAARTGKSHEPNPALPVNLAFPGSATYSGQAAGLTMRVLLISSDGPLDAARIADEAGFAKRNVSDVLTSLATSGVIRAAWAGNERRFTAHGERWALFLDLAGPADLPSFVSWVHLLPAGVEEISNRSTRSSGESEYLIAGQGPQAHEPPHPAILRPQTLIPSTSSQPTGLLTYPYSSKPATLSWLG